MSVVSQVMSAPVVFADTEMTLRSVAATMAGEGVGSVIVLGPRGPSMVVTEQDIVSALAAGSNPDSTWAVDVGSAELTTVEPDTLLMTAIQIMATRDIRHLPVQFRGEIVGMVSVRDLLRVLAHTGCGD